MNQLTAQEIAVYAQKRLRLKFIPNRKMTRYANSKANIRWLFYGAIRSVPIFIAKRILLDHPYAFVQAKEGEKEIKPTIAVETGLPEIPEVNPFAAPEEMTEEDIVDIQSIMDTLNASKDVDVDEITLDELDISDLPDANMRQFDSISAEVQLAREQVEAENGIGDIELAQKPVNAVQPELVVQKQKPVPVPIDESLEIVRQVVERNAPIKITAIAKAVGADSYREIEPAIKELLTSGLIERTETSEYVLAS